MWIVALLVMMLFATISCSPMTPVSALPDARQAEGARLTFDQVRRAAGAGRPVNLTIDRDRFEGSAIVAARTFGIKRIAVSHFDDQFAVKTSIPLPTGLWLNITARPRPSNKGFPAIPVKIGWLPVPAFITRIGLETVRFGLWMKGMPVPDLDIIVRRFDVKDNHVAALVQVPRGSGLQKALLTFQTHPVDPRLVARHYCRLVDAERASPAEDLASHIRRAFENGGDVEDNRAALVALGMLTISPKVGDLAGDAALRVKSCPQPPIGFTLLGRSDLAKHWTLSAALAAAFGGDVSTRVGVWKEIADSEFSEGFSFVDLAADRSGIALALKAVNPKTAGATSEKLAQATEAEILPIKMLALAEGLSEDEFIKRYVSVESREFYAVQARIDRTLAAAFAE